VEKAVATAEACFPVWRKKTFAERAAVLSKAAAILRSRADEFAGLITLEMGKLFAESRGEVALSADIIDYYAERAESGIHQQEAGLRSPDRRPCAERRQS
jgi:succinate-semialdehyde dehydrogenase/glutarate-semialdehyde dehydrogenase